MAFATAINELAEQEDSADSDIDSHDNDEILAIELSLLRNIATLLRPRKTLSLHGEGHSVNCK